MRGGVCQSPSAGIGRPRPRRSVRPAILFETRRTMVALFERAGRSRLARLTRTYCLTARSGDRSEVELVSRSGFIGAWRNGTDEFIRFTVAGRRRFTSLARHRRYRSLQSCAVLQGHV